MQRSESIIQLVTALAKAQGKVTGAKKDSSNPFFKSNYADLASVWEAIREPFSANGLAIVQMPQEDEKGIFLETCLTHESGEWMSGILRVNPVKNDPQGIGSAITYARRYALQSVAGVAPVDDDGEAAHGRGAKNGAEKEPAAQPEKHRPHANYEEAKPSKPESAVADVAMMRTWCKEHFIDELHVLACARKGKMIDERVLTLENIPPGVLNRLWGARARILATWQETADKGKAPETPPEGQEEASGAKRNYNLETGDRGAKTVREPCQIEVPPEDMLRAEERDWREVRVHFGKNEGLQIEEMTKEQLDWYCDHWKPLKHKGKFSKDDLLLDAALCIAAAKRT